MACAIVDYWQNLQKKFEDLFKKPVFFLSSELFKKAKEEYRL